MGRHMTSFTADAMRGFVGELAADSQARTNLAEQNRQDVGAMLKQSATDRQNAEVLRSLQSRQANEARIRFVSRLKTNVSSLMGDFSSMRMEMASEIQAAGDIFRNRNLQGGGCVPVPVAQPPKASHARTEAGPIVEQLVARHQPVPQVLETVVNPPPVAVPEAGGDVPQTP